MNLVYIFCIRSLKSAKPKWAIACESFAPAAPMHNNEHWINESNAERFNKFWLNFIKVFERNKKKHGGKYVHRISPQFMMLWMKNVIWIDFKKWFKHDFTFLAWKREKNMPCALNWSACINKWERDVCTIFNKKWFSLSSKKGFVYDFQHCTTTELWPVYACVCVCFCGPWFGITWPIKWKFLRSKQKGRPLICLVLEEKMRQRERETSCKTSDSRHLVFAVA